MLDLLYRPLLFLHILAGTLALVCSIIAFASSKWSKLHRVAGAIFFWSMLFTAVSSVPPAIHSNKWVLLLVAVFSFHLTYSGRRYIQFRQGKKANFIDYTISGLAVVFGLLLWGYGVPVFYKAMGVMGASAPFAFGFLSMMMAKEDFQWYLGKNASPKLALRRHIGRMGGATIAAFTAFFVNVNFVVPGGLAWILPTVLGSFLIAYYTRKLRLNRPIR
ncbi:MAG: hypothetical protein AAFP77_06820 [Bacteroidota bacterium]